MPTSNHGATWIALDAISQALISSNDSADLRGLLWGKDDWPRWYHQLLNQIHALAADSPVEYITSSVRDSRIEGDDVYAFTATLVIHASVSDFVGSGSREDAIVRTTGWLRTSLTGMTVVNLSPCPVEERGTEVAFPRNLTLDLHYGPRPALRLPLPTLARGNALENLYPSLLANLARGELASKAPQGIAPGSKA